MEKGNRLHQSLSIGLQQRLTARQIQLIRLLQTPMLQLDQLVKQELERNPALEEGEAPEDTELAAEERVEEMDAEDRLDESEEYTPEDYASEDDEPADAYPARSGEELDRDRWQMAATSSNRDALLEQLRFLHLDPHIQALAEYIVGNLDEDGYLRRTLDDLADELFIDSNLQASESDLSAALGVVQSLDPRGVGARDLRECLLLQIGEPVPGESMVAYRILRECYAPFAARQYERIMDRLAIDAATLREGLEYISSLNPRPADLRGNDGHAGAQAIEPDFVLHVEQGTGEIGITLNDRNRPLLHVSPGYLDMLRQYSTAASKQQRQGREAARFLRAKVDEAHQFIDALHQRNRTLLRVMETIAAAQHEYFLDGDVQKLRPMILKDIAEATGYDISTISRIVNSKHVETPYGIRALRDFFSEGSQTRDGESVSTRAIKERLQSLIAGEDKQHPLSDEQLVLALESEGYTIARRTVAKYREQLAFPVARLRRQA